MSRIYREAMISSPRGLPMYLPPSSISGQTNLWDARAANVAVGDEVVSLPPANGGTLNLTAGAAGASKGPTLGQDSFGKFLSFNGIDQAIGAAMSRPVPHVVALVARVRTIRPDTITPLVGMNAGSVVVMGTTTAGNPRMNAGASMDSAAAVVAGSIYAWVGSFNGANSGLRVESSLTDVKAATGNSGANVTGNLSLGRWLNNFGAIDIYRITTWNRALTGGEYAALAAEQRAAFGIG